ncbi:MAG: tRNA preQ1(34) S-adenosylmethionine ribosyltransferase-isomerase QueA [Parvularculaceae bacterium]
MKLTDFDYELPADRIALRPADPRDSARLLQVGGRGGQFSDYRMFDLPRLLDDGDLLVVNNAKVIPALLHGRREPRNPEDRGAAIETTLHRRTAEDSWMAFLRPAKRVRKGDKITYGADFEAVAESTATDGEILLRFNKSGAEFDKALRAAGAMPLPPYIARRRTPDSGDAQDYQTLFAKKSGAVAAPTAGLHFTPSLLDAIAARGVGVAEITLEVGAGTFLPVKSETIEAHKMHTERFEISEQAASKINETRRKGGRIVAVGTTSLRTLESAATDDGSITPCAGETDLFITPGYRFKAADMLLTNFHLPRSTLLMLVAAFAGLDRIKAAYEHAKENGYRFYSYGDACLLYRNP